MRPTRLAALAVVLGGFSLGACGGAERSAEPVAGESEAAEPTTATSPAPAESEQRFPAVVDATAARSSANTLRFDVTISSPYDSPTRYADAWRLVGPDGTVYGIRELLHDHAAEQPFTRSLDGVEIPDAVDTVTVEARDLVNGWGGETRTLDLTALRGP